MINLLKLNINVYLFYYKKYYKYIWIKEVILFNYYDLIIILKIYKKILLYNIMKLLNYNKFK